MKAGLFAETAMCFPSGDQAGAKAENGAGTRRDSPVASVTMVMTLSSYPVAHAIRVPSGDQSSPKTGVKLPTPTPLAVALLIRAMSRGAPPRAGTTWMPSLDWEAISLLSGDQRGQRKFPVVSLVSAMGRPLLTWLTWICIPVEGPDA